MAIEIKAANKFTSFPLLEVTEIFFETSNIKEFKSIEEREKFFFRWCGQYLESYPDFFLVALEEGKVLGYCCAHPDSFKALEDFKIPGQELFSEHFEDYPLHLHINCHLESRGKGVGKKLITTQSLLSKTGIHIITEKGADNRKFYRAIGFDAEVEADYKGQALLFMGKAAIL